MNPPPVQLIVSRLIDELDPERILRITEAVGESEVLSLVVETRAPGDAPERIASVLASFPRRTWSLNVVVCPAGDRSLSDPSVGTILYERR